MPDIANNQPSPHLGSGLSYPLRINLQGNLQLSSATRNIEESIFLILGTKIGERVYRPTFGSRLSELVFAPMNTQTLMLIRLHVQQALEMWEPRIIVDGVYTEPDPMRGRVDILIEYHPKDSHDTRSLVYPFYLLPPS
ncbi:GPW/gp25 family protein [Ancylothrix sp. C2]|uniref:GPW/gp25 family protein n=1 Tax=Ancylothrix sp. D3o TaxID=2953691 RepID=UPI0021BABB6C|nr:GPW/gp25 family protein [Ancylothrix sp. D3o]MCT7948228.1 GPW/gp25 family protein [Ancylothrix sp. D3o]